MAHVVTTRPETFGPAPAKQPSKFRLPSPAIVVPALLACVFLLRLPSALLPYEMQVDESEMLSEAMKFMVSPIPWKAVDGGTSGPLNAYLITVFLVAGFKPTYVLIHILASLLVCAQVLLAYLTLRRLSSERTAILGAAVLVFLYGFYTNQLFLHYGTELLAVVLTMAGFYAFAVLMDETREHSAGNRCWTLFFGALTLGAAPWAKLQAAPITLAGGLLLLATILRRRRTPVSGAHRIAELLAFVGGALFTTLAMLAAVTASGAIKDFWYSDILNNAAFAGKLHVSHLVGNLILVIIGTPVHLLLAVAIVAVSLLDYASPSGELKALVKRRRWAISGLALYSAAAMFATCRVNYFAAKHAMFFIPPMACIVALLASAAITAFARHRRLTVESIDWSRSVPVLSIVLLLLTVALFGAYIVRYGRMLQAIHEINLRPADWAATSGLSVPGPKNASDNASMMSNLTEAIGPRNWTLPSTNFSNERTAAVVREIQKQRPIRSLSVWGWAPGLYVLTGMPPATRETNTFFSIAGSSPYQEYYRSRYLIDLRTNPPDLFIDTVVGGAFLWPWPPRWTEEDGFESDPELKRFIGQNYVLIHELALKPGAKPVRFFARRTSADTLGDGAT